jgi:hypothetical protein
MGAGLSKQFLGRISVAGLSFRNRGNETAISGRSGLGLGHCFREQTVPEIEQRPHGTAHRLIGQAKTLEQLPIRDFDQRLRGKNIRPGEPLQRWYRLTAR